MNRFLHSRSVIIEGSVRAAKTNNVPRFTLRSRGHMIGGGVNRPRNIANPPGATVMGSRDAKLRAAMLEPLHSGIPRRTLPTVYSRC